MDVMEKRVQVRKHNLDGCFRELVYLKVRDGRIVQLLLLVRTDLLILLVQPRNDAVESKYYTVIGTDKVT